MSHLQALMANRIASGLKRRSLTSCSRWAEACRIMGGNSFPGPWRFKHHPWLKEMHDSEAELNVGQKAAQMGYTEVVLNTVFYNIDIKGVDALYVLPAKTPDASDFSASRFDPALELSPHLANMFSDVKNIGHKRAGTSNLYIRGSRSRSGLKSIPTGLIILDELDEMTQDNVPLAMERAAGQREKRIWMISTATLDNFGINAYFNDSSQNHFYFRCPSCSRFIELKFPESLVVTADEITDPNIKNSHLICYECKAKLPHEDKSIFLQNNQWVPTFTDRDSAGWHINQMYSPTITPVEFARSFVKSKIDPASETEFYNSKLGLPHRVEGSSVTDELLEKAKRGYRRIDAIRGDGLYTLGIDVGKWCHWVIKQWFLPPEGTPAVDISVLAKCKVLTFGKCLDFPDLDRLMYDFGINFAVIDAQPERRKSLEFCNRHYRRAKMCFYAEGVNGKNIHVTSEHDGEPSIRVDRTSWLDLTLGRFHNGSIVIPYDVDLEYREHMKALTRVYKKDKEGNPVGRYDKGNVDDHYAHASNYAEIALPLALRGGEAQNIESP